MNPLYGQAIADLESGGAYDKLGPLTRSGDRAYGKYQVMGNNIGPWTREVLGRELTPQDFLKDQAAQDAVFNHKFGASVEKYGNPQDAASVWFSGRPLAQAGNASDVLGTTVPKYVSNFTSRLNSYGGGVNAIDAAMRAKSGGSPVTPIATPAAPDESNPLRQVSGFFNRMNYTNPQTGYDVADAMNGAGASMMALDNAKGAAVLAAMQAQNRKQSAKVPEFAYDAKSGTFYRTRADGTLETTKNPNASADEEHKAKLTEAALKNTGESVEKYGTIAAINKEASDVLDDLHTGKLNLGMFKNWMNSGQNMAGLSDEQSRSYARYQQFLQKVANDNLLLNKGVQTEGDAYREMKAIGAGGASYDNEAAKEALKKLISRGQEAVTQRGRSVLDAHISTYGAEPFKPFTEQADRWKGIYDDINTRMATYPKSGQTSNAPAKTGKFEVIGVRHP
jgi:hypothetical protein